VVEQLRMQLVGVEIAGSNSSQFFFDIFVHPRLSILLEYFDPPIYAKLVFSCNLMALSNKRFELLWLTYKQMDSLSLVVYPVGVTKLLSKKLSITL